MYIWTYIVKRKGNIRAQVREILPTTFSASKKAIKFEGELYHFQLARISFKIIYWANYQVGFVIF